MLPMPLPLFNLEIEILLAPHALFVTLISQFIFTRMLKNNVQSEFLDEG